MKCPKYVKAMIARRAKLASDLNVVDYDLCTWLERHGILDRLETYDTFGGAEIYVNPMASARRILDAIEREGADQ